MIKNISFLCFLYSLFVVFFVIIFLIFLPMPVYITGIKSTKIEIGEELVYESLLCKTIIDVPLDNHKIQKLQTKIEEIDSQVFDKNFWEFKQIEKGEKIRLKMKTLSLCDTENFSSPKLIKIKLHSESFFYFAWKRIFS